MLPPLVYSFWSVLIQSSLEISLGGNKVHAHRLKLPDQKCAMDRKPKHRSLWKSLQVQELSERFVKLFSSLVYQEKPATIITNTNHHEWLSKQMTPHSNLLEVKTPTLLRRTKKTTNCNVNWLLQECSDQIPSSGKGSKPYQTRGDAFCFIQLAC